MNSRDLEPKAFFTTDGTDLWILGTFCLHPTCELTNVATGQVEGFGMGGLTAERFRRILPPDIAREAIETMAQEIISLRAQIKPFLKDSPNA